jgi:hypothetical protein
VAASRESARRAGRHTLSFTLATAALGSLWALATPVMGVPDEPAHVRRAAALVRGQLIGETATTPEGDRLDTVRVPETLGRLDEPCFAHSGLPGCDQPISGRGDVLVEVESRASRYNPVYYGLVGLPTLVEPGRSTVYVMRLVSAIFVALLLTLGARSLAELPRPKWALAGLAVAVTPMTLFLAGSVNPNAVEIAAGVGLWATLLVWVRAPDPRLDTARAWRAAICAVSLVLPRALGPLLLALVLLGAVIAAPPGTLGTLARRRAARAAALVVALASAAALAWTLVVGTLDTQTVAFPQYENARRFLYDVIVSLPEWERQMIGVFGWLDTPAQEHVYVAWFALLGAFTLGAVAVGPGRIRLLLGLLLAASAVVPAVVQLPAATELGLPWQGRYLLALMAGLPLVAGITVASSHRWDDIYGGWSLGAVLVVVGLAQVASFWWALHRNVIGLGEAWIGFTPLWQPPLGWIALTALYALVTTVWLWTLALLARGLPRLSE